MTTYLAKKLLTLLLLLGLVSITVFAVLFVLPGDPAQVILGINATPETLATLRAELGMDKPFLGQYLEWIARLLAGQSYQSIHYKMPVFDLILGSLAVTGPMALFAMVFAVLISLPLGIFAARHQNRTGDVTVMFFTQLGLATPEFWFGILLILLFSVKLGWFAAGGFPGWATDVWGSLRALLLPAFALGVIRASILTRLTRSSMLEVLREDYVRTARAKGLRERTVIYVHALRNALIPVLDHHGAAARAAAGGRDHHRKRLLPAGAGTAGVQRHRPARPAGGARHRPVHGRRGRGRELHRRPGLRLRRPESEGEIVRRFFGNKNFTVGFALSAVVVILAAVSLVWTPFDGNRMNAREKLQGPTWKHPLGTDQYGRDTLSRVMTGAVNSIIVGLVTVAIGLTLGVALGLLAAFRGRFTDEVIMRFSDLLFGFPAVLTAILITSILGPSMVNAMLAIGVFYIPVFARLTRAVAMVVWEREYIVAARACGIGELAITWRHVIPNILSPLLIQGTIQFAVAILAEAGLSYLGLGTQPPDASWGRMLNEAQTYMSTAPWMAIFPGVAIAWAVLGFNLLGDGLRDTLDPKMVRMR